MTTVKLHLETRQVVIYRNDASLEQWPGDSRFDSGTGDTTLHCRRQSQASEGHVDGLKNAHPARNFVWSRFPLPRFLLSKWLVFIFGLRKISVASRQTYIDRTGRSSCLCWAVGLLAPARLSATGDRDDRDGPRRCRGRWPRNRPSGRTRAGMKCLGVKRGIDGPSLRGKRARTRPGGADGSRGPPLVLI